MLKKLILTLAVVALAASVSAQTVTCSVSGLTAKQTALLADFLASVNAQRVEAGQAPFANFSAYCVRRQEQVNAAKVAAASVANGDQVAPNGQCLPNGCTKNQVACFVLTGNADCNR